MKLHRGLIDNILKLWNLFQTLSPFTTIIVAKSTPSFIYKITTNKNVLNNSSITLMVNEF